MEEIAKAKEEAEKRSETEKENLKELIKEVAGAKEEAEKRHQEMMNQKEQENKDLKEFMKRLGAAFNLPSENAATQNLQEVGKSNYSEQTVTENSQHSDTTATQGLHKTNGATQASNIATESSDELDDDIVVIPDPSSYIDEPMLSNYVSSNLSR
ncbi:hypothetical protein NPIL_595171 [Nephila pilipes]|uniref:Uncharacterized protein n=1 Tax=Nephila pilipes TaxID=299642 RepID=A0A8X6MYM9_NEPPI|nr:hypothetical protein NPIL_595171 [Nephila pilipes]